MYVASSASNINFFVRNVRWVIVVKHIFCTVGGEEDVFVDEEDIDCQLQVFVKLDELGWYLDDALRHLLSILLYRVPLHFQH